jgi:hypothetical protein
VSGSRALPFGGLDAGASGTGFRRSPFWKRLGGSGLSVFRERFLIACAEKGSFGEDFARLQRKSATDLKSRAQT